MEFGRHPYLRASASAPSTPRPSLHHHYSTITTPPSLLHHHFFGTLTDRVSPMSVPILTIPESAFDASSYTSRRQTSNTLRFLLTLTRTSALSLVLAYLVSLLAIKPLMERATDQRLDFLEACRCRLRDLYLSAISRVEHIPIVGIDRGDGSGKKYADSVCQTDDLKEKQLAETPTETLGQASICSKLEKLSARLHECKGYHSGQFSHYKVTEYSLKDLKGKVDMVFFDQTKLFIGTLARGSKTANKPLNLASEVKNNIRSIKGMFMSGQA